MPFVVFLVSFLSSTAGAICGIGGGVIIKPVLDSLSIVPVATANFLSGCTVLSMTCFSVGSRLIKHESMVEFKIATPLSIGSAVGGVLGKNLFETIKNHAAQSEQVGVYQSICLAVITLAALMYTISRNRISTHNIKNPLLCVLTGMGLGLMSSFLGIGGGPVNLVVLYYFFSMTTKIAVQNSLYIILVSQSASLITSIVSGNVPSFQILWLLLMVCGGIGGGIAGRKLNNHLGDSKVQNLFVGLMIVIICISCYNTFRFQASI